MNVRTNAQQRALEVTQNNATGGLVSIDATTGKLTRISQSSVTNNITLLLI